MSTVNLADLIRRRMEEKRMSKTELAKKIGVTRPHIYRILNTETDDMKLSTFIRLSIALDEHPVALLRTVLATNQYYRHYKKAVDLPTPYVGDAIGYVGAKDEGDLVYAGSRFYQTWIIQNIGKQPWVNRKLVCVDEYVAFVVKNDDIGGLSSHRTLVPDEREINIPETRSGEQVELTANFTAPNMPGTFHSFWKMTDSSNVFCFPENEALFCRVIVQSI